MTTFAPHRDAVEFFVDCMHGGADKDTLSGILAEDVVLYGPLGDAPLTGRAAVLEAMRTVGTVAADLTYKEVLSGETHHAAYFRLQIENTVGPLFFLLGPTRTFENGLPRHAPVPSESTLSSDARRSGHDCCPPRQVADLC